MGCSGFGAIMYKILIVDDEYWVGRWLKEVLGASGLDIELKGICKDGEEACRILRQETVDILITDINMPVRNGLELIRSLMEYQENMPKTIIISGYDEFEYARQAIDLKVTAYLLKPLQRGELFDAIGKAVRAIEHEKENTRSMNTGYRAAVENILTNFFQNPKEDVKQKLGEMLVFKELNEKGYLVGLIQSQELKMGRLSQEEIQDRLSKAARGQWVFLVKRDPFTWGFLVAGIEKADGFFLEDQYLYQLLREHSLGVSKIHFGLEELEEALGEARDIIIRRNSLHREGGMVFSPMLELGSEFLAAITDCDREKVREYTKMAEESFRQEQEMLTSCLNFYFIMTGDLIKLLTDYYKIEQDERYLELIEEGYEFSARIRRFYSTESICRKFEEYSLLVIGLLKDRTALKVSDIVQKVQRIIRERYNEDLNLGSLADMFSINPSYFSKKFKEETGINFVDYLAGVRIEHAKSLLENTELSISRISSQVGFNDAKYFSKVFYSVTQMRPTEYRNWKKEDKEHETLFSQQTIP